MAHTLSAKKRIRQNQKRHSLNRWRKRRIHGAIRAFDKSIQAGDGGAASEAFKGVCSVLDKVAGTGTIHRNKAARKKSRLARRLNTLLASHS